MLRACIVGPNYQLFSCSDDETELTTDYDYENDECFSWPGRPAGGVVDQSYTQVCMYDALLRYYLNSAGDASEIQAVSGYENRVRAASAIFKTANGFTRDSDLYSRNVMPGDVVKLTGTACGEVTTLWSTVVSLIADKIAAVVAAATADEIGRAHV